MKTLIKTHLIEWTKFVIVGIGAVLIDFTVYFTLLRFTPLSTSLSKAISFSSGAILSFIGHRQFVFNATHKHIKKQILPFMALYGSSLILNNIVNELILVTLNIKLVAWFTSTTVSVLWNYLGMKLGVFRKKAI